MSFTAQGYVTHLGRVQGLRGGRLDSAVTASIDRLALGQYASRPLRELSKGSCQKAAVAQVLLGEPVLLALDEAWTGLDAETRAAWTGRSPNGWPPAPRCCSSTTTQPAWAHWRARSGL